MKFNFLLSALLFVAITSSCKKDETKTNTADIVGQWRWVKQVYDSYDGDQLTSYNEYTTQLDTAAYFEFDNGGVFIEKIQGQDHHLNYGNYHIKGDSVFIKRDIDSKADGYQITTLTKNSLVIHYTSISGTDHGDREYTMKR